MVSGAGEHVTPSMMQDRGRRQDRSLTSSPSRLILKRAPPGSNQEDYACLTLRASEKKSACADDERTCPLPHKARKCRVDVTRSADIQHNKLQAKSTRGRLHFVHLRGIRNIQVHEQSDDGRIGDEFVQQRELLRHQIDTVAAEGSISLVLS
jgi:hypothetical protein